jgi:molybdate transport repressor ModE-like protein
MLLADTVRQMLEADEDLVCPSYKEHRGHPVLISSRLISGVFAYQGDGGLRGYIRTVENTGSVKVIPVEDDGIIMTLETSDDLTREEIQNRCVDIHPNVHLELRRDDVFFDSTTAHFLSLIANAGSMRTACAQMHMSYTKGWKMIKNAEKQLGFPLLFSVSGGMEGGFSELTPKAKELLSRYLLIEKQLREEAVRLYHEYFGITER